MHDRVELSSDLSKESKESSLDQFTDEENQLINHILKELDTDDAKELEACKTKLTAAEQEIAALHVQLKKLTQQLAEELSRNMLGRKQMIDLHNKVKMSEDELSLAQAQIQALKKLIRKTDMETKPLTPPPPLEEADEDGIVILGAPPSPLADDAGLRQRFAHGRESEIRPSLFRRDTQKKEDVRPRGESCMEADTCTIL